MRIPFEELRRTLARCLMERGFTKDRALRCAHIFAENSLVGVASHGLNRFPRFLQWIDHGWIDPVAESVRMATQGSFERWDGNLGPGPLNAEQCMKRATEIAIDNGLGCVALRNTNHWMRAGTYAWQAADNGFLGICFTNTKPNLPPWGSLEPKLGNNPIAMAIPRANGAHVLFDGAMSQFSYGALESAARKHAVLPVPGGFNQAGELTDNPAEIIASQRPLPIGYWKGSGLSLLLDLFATVLTEGRSTQELGRQADEYGVSQVFIAFSKAFVDSRAADSIERAVSNLHSAQASDAAPVRYPGERLFRIRAENTERGVPVDARIWTEVSKLQAP